LLFKSTLYICMYIYVCHCTARDRVYIRVQIHMYVHFSELASVYTHARMDAWHEIDDLDRSASAVRVTNLRRMHVGSVSDDIAGNAYADRDIVYVSTCIDPPNTSHSPFVTIDMYYVVLLYFLQRNVKTSIDLDKSKQNTIALSNVINVISYYIYIYIRSSTYLKAKSNIIFEILVFKFFSSSPKSIVEGCCGKH
jgi:hypothetical protein